MNEKYCVSLELSQKLKEVGYPQEGEFWWVITYTTNWHVSYREPDKKWQELNKGNFYIASLASELMERLPGSIETKDKNFPRHLDFVKENGLYGFRYGRNPFENKEYPWITDSNLCNALAKMYIYLAEKGLIK